MGTVSFIAFCNRLLMCCLNCCVTVEQRTGKSVWFGFEWD